MPSFINKLSVKSVAGDLKKLAATKELNENIPVARIWGLAGKKVETGTTDNGDWLRFTGSFEAVSLITGEHKASVKLHLPDIAQNILLGSIENLDDGAKVEFAFDISITINDTPIGYSFEAKPLSDLVENDPMMQLSKKYSTSLPSPKDDNIPSPDKGKAKSAQK